MKKSIIALLLAAVCLFTAACGNETPEPTAETPETAEPVPTETTEPPVPEISWMKLPADRQITAKQYFVYDCETGEFLVRAESEDTKIYPASVTKLFTAYVALQYLKPGQLITAGDALDRVVPGSSVAEIKKGDQVSVEALVEGMLLPSGNDAAWLLAEAAGRILMGKNGSKATPTEAVIRFVSEMNAQAKLLGMTGTNFDNPDGIHSENHYTTYRDLAIMATAALEEPVILRYAKVSKDQVTLASGTVNWKNTNELINPESPYYCEACLGLKTGQTPKAGSCLVSAFEFGGKTYVIGVFGCPEIDDRFPDTLQLLNQVLGIS